MHPSGWFAAEARAAGFDSEMARRIGEFMMRVMDQQAVDERLNYSYLDSAVLGAGLRPATVVVAAYDSTDAEKAGADIVCDFTDDDVDVQAALDLGATGRIGCQVLMLSGHYSFSADVDVPSNSTVRGMGKGSRIADGGFAMGSAAILADLYIDGGNITVGGAGAAVNYILSNVTVVGAVDLASGCIMTTCWIAGPVTLVGQGVVVTGSRITAFSASTDAVTFDPASDDCRVTGCFVYTVSGTGVVMDGDHNALSSCTVAGQPTTDLTGQAISVDGDHNSITDVVFNPLGASNTYDYGINVLAGSTAARIKLNDLRSGGFSVAAYNNAGTATVASENDI